MSAPSGQMAATAAQTTEALNSLFALARDPSEAGRVKLAQALTDIFLKGDIALSPRESAMVWALIEDLLRQTSSNIRELLSRRVAQMASAPRPLVKKLAKDDAISVARTVLETSTTLTDDDLIEVIGEKSRDHALAIAHRRSVSEAVADALIVTGDLDIMKTVAENLGARLSPRAVYRLADVARVEEDLRPSLVRRPELPGDVATRLYWWMPRDLRRLMLRRFGFSNGQVEAALEAALEELLSKYQLDRNDDLALRQVVDWLAEREVISSKLMIQILRMGYYRLFNHLLSRACNLPLPLADLVVAETGGRALAACARFMECDKPSFVSLFLLSRGGRPGDQIVHPRELTHALATFDKVNKAFAERMLEMWRRYPNALLTGFNQGVGEDA